MHILFGHLIWASLMAFSNKPNGSSTFMYLPIGTNLIEEKKYCH